MPFAPVDLAPNALRSKLVGIALDTPEFRDALNSAASEIRQVALPKVTEATIEGQFERVVYARLREIGLSFNPAKEVTVARRHTMRGRADSRLGALVIEYKRPTLLRQKAAREAAIEQLTEYLEALSKESGAPFKGILTDGLTVIEVDAVDGRTSAASPPQPLDGPFLRRFTTHVISLALTALTAENLVRDFCGAETDGVLFECARLLNGVLANAPEPKTNMLRSEWEQLFRLAHDDHSQQRRVDDRRRALAEIIGHPISSASVEYRALFALHTAYAILLKFIAYRVLSDIYLGRVPQDFRDLTNADSMALRAFCSRLEDGDIFRQLGIVNLLEGDFFSWYSDDEQWTDDLADTIRQMLHILARYEEASNIFASERAVDLFRELYQAAVPRAVRSSFGEVYTPGWLAEHVINTAVTTAGWRMLDPCCGSGTFVVAAIDRVRRESEATATELRDEILARVAGIDLHPLGVLTTRINYFIHLSDLLGEADDEIVIPVYLGDASSIPSREQLDGVEILRYQLTTLRTPINSALPSSLVRDTPRFIELMRGYERLIQERNPEGASKLLVEHTVEKDRTPGVTHAIQRLSQELVALEVNGWNGIWARILSNFLTTACLGRFEVIAGNPPWIDWKNLPAGYRERIKALCIDRGLFSGAGRTGGINLNICALIAHVSLTNWLTDDGRLAFLMPRELAYQASYEGWRRLGGGPWRFVAFHDWTNAGYPFDPIREDFMTFVLSREAPATAAVPGVRWVADRGARSSEWQSFSEADECLTPRPMAALQLTPEKTAFTIAESAAELHGFTRVAGSCEYIGRDGIQFYPQELLLFRYVERGPRPGTAWLENVQVPRAQHRVPRKRVLLEVKFLRPLVRSREIERFKHEYGGLVVPFPYAPTSPRKPLSASTLERESPFLLDYYRDHRDVLEKLSGGNMRIRSDDPGEFYSLGRTGAYSFAGVYVTFRKDTKWRAAVVSSVPVPWGPSMPLVFQSHAVSVCERSDGSFITEDEAHYVCAVLNAPIVERFITASSDARSFKVRPPVYVPTYDPMNGDHTALSQYSRAAHASPDDMNDILADIGNVYQRICLARGRQ